MISFNNRAFTIVELLVVIVVIGVLAGISLVSYSGIQRHALAANLQSNLDSNSKLLKLYNVEYGSYPSALDSDYCPERPIVDSKYCLKILDNSTVVYGGADDNFALTAIISSSNIAYTVTEGSVPDEYYLSTANIRTWGGIYHDYAKSVIVTKDGGFAVGGYSESFGGVGNENGYIAKYKSDGNLDWNKTWGGEGGDAALSLTEANDGGLVIMGYSDSFTSAFNYETFITKFSRDGNFEWDVAWGGDDRDMPTGIAKTKDGCYIISGSTLSFGAGDSDAFIAKIDGNGTLLWEKTIEGDTEDSAYSVIEDSTGNYLLAGTTYGFSSSLALSDAFVSSFDKDGNLLWTKTFGHPDHDDQINSISKTSDGGFVVSGYTWGYNAGDEDILTIKFSISGEIEWSRVWGGTAADHGNSVIQTFDGGYLIGGQTDSFGAGNANSVLIKYDRDGNLSWARTFGSADNDWSNAAVQLFDGMYLSVGRLEGYGAGQRDSYLARYDNNGLIDGCGSSVCKSVTGITQNPSIIANSRDETSNSVIVDVLSPNAVIANPTATLNVIF